MLAKSGAQDEAELVLLELLEALPDLAARDETRRDARRALAEIYESRGDELSAERYRALLGTD